MYGFQRPRQLQANFARLQFHGKRLTQVFRDYRAVEWCRTSRIDVVRQYVRLLESLVLFAENELVPEPAS